MSERSERIAKAQREREVCALRADLPSCFGDFLRPLPLGLPSVRPGGLRPGMVRFLTITLASALVVVCVWGVGSRARRRARVARRPGPAAGIRRAGRIVRPTYCGLRCSGQDTPLYSAQCQLPACSCLPGITPRNDLGRHVLHPQQGRRGEPRDRGPTERSAGPSTAATSAAGTAGSGSGASRTPSSSSRRPAPRPSSGRAAMPSSRRRR